MIPRSRGADVLIVGAGIAGLSAAWFAVRAGRRVIVVDDGRHRASDLPIALVNPLRGHRGRLVDQGVEGMHATFALVDALCAEGHAIDHGRGLYRPLIDLAGDLLTEEYWRARLESRLAFDWHPAAPRSLGLSTDVPSLRLRDAGWVAAPDLLRALRTASGATIVEGRVVAIRPDAGDRSAVATIDDGTTIDARSLLWCGGAWGAACLDRDEPGDGLYRPGSLLTTNARLADVPLAFGLYTIPVGGDAAATLVGPTREGSTAVFTVSDTPADAVASLEERVARTFVASASLRPTWRGVRLARLSTAAQRALGGVATLTAFGSRGFLMAPLAAETWARSL